MGIQEALIAAVQAMEAQKIPYKEAKKLFRRQLVYSAVNRHSGRVPSAAKELGISAQSINYTIRRDAAERVNPKESE